MELPDAAVCPGCGADPTPDSIVRQRLSALGYAHRDTKLRCDECETRWVVGEPRGEPDALSEWTCDGCGGELLPHFVFVAVHERELQIRPKCRDCFWVPDDRIEISLDGHGESLHGLLGLPQVTGAMDGHPE